MMSRFDVLLSISTSAAIAGHHAVVGVLLAAGAAVDTVGWCRLTASKPVLKARLVSLLET
jgi:hypothetical protein